LGFSNRSVDAFFRDALILGGVGGGDRSPYSAVSTGTVGWHNLEGGKGKGERGKGKGEGGKAKGEGGKAKGERGALKES
jgi:hypothetical protein